MTVPTYLPYYVLGGTLAIIAAVLIALHRGVRRANWPPAERIAIVRAAALVLVGWFAAAAALAWLEAYRVASDQLPTIQYGILIPILIGSLAIWRSATIGRLIDAVPQAWLVGVQFYRALGVIFLVLHFSGRLPGVFAWPAGVGDIAIGLAAPIIAAFSVRNPEANRAVATWNLLGIADLVVAVGTGFLSSPSPLQLFAFDSPSELVTMFPLVLVPVYLVPLSILLHLASLTKLKRSPSLPRARAPAAAE